MDTKPSKPSPLNELASLKAENARLTERLEKLQKERDLLHTIFTRVLGLLNKATPYVHWPLGKLHLLILSIDDIVRPL
jgi:hypothetical protein